MSSDIRDVEERNSRSSSSSSSSNSAAQSIGQHPYRGFDSEAAERVHELARTLTSQSLLYTANSNNSSSSNHNAHNADSRSVFSTDMEGVNPVFTNPDTPGYNPKLDPNSDQFSSTAWVQNMANICTSDPDFYKPYSLGCVWKNLSASGDSADVHTSQLSLTSYQSCLRKGSDY